MFDISNIKLDQIVWHEQTYLHPQLGIATRRDFYDRDAELTRALKLLTDKVTREVAILGERRAGKTSIMKRIGASCADSANSIGFVPIPHAGIHTLQQLASEILHAVRNYVQPIGAQHVVDRSISPTYETLPEFMYSLHDLMTHVPNRRLVLAIDEFDSILVYARSPHEIIELASALVKEPSFDIRLLLTMAHIPNLLINTPLELQSAEVITLHPFPRSDMDQMILEIVGEQHSIETRDLQTIYELSGGWPYFAKLILQGMADLSSGPGQMERAVQAAIDNESGTMRIANIYHEHLDDQEKMLMLLLAEGDGQLTADEMAVLGSAIQSKARCLAERDYLQLEPDGGCRFRVGLLGPWFRNWSLYAWEVAKYLSAVPHRVEKDCDLLFAED